MREVLVLWDLDGTLVSAPGLGDRLYREVFHDLFGRPLGPIAPKAGRTDRAIIIETLAMAGIDSPRSHVDAFLVALDTVTRAQDGASDVRALPGAAAAIAALASHAGNCVLVRQSVLTGNIRPGAELKLRRAGLATHLDLDAGAYGDTHEARTELVAIARSAAAARYAVGPEAFAGQATVLIGDTPLDVAAALAAGARAVAVATGTFSRGQLAAAGAHAVLPDLTDVAAVVDAVVR